MKDSFSLTAALPLPDIYKRSIADQFIKLSNYDIVSVNEFEFTNLSLYNFKVSEETITQLSNANLQIMLDEKSVHGQISMAKLLLAPNFHLKVTIPLKKSVTVEAKKKKLTPQQKKQMMLDKAKGKAVDDEETKERTIVTHAGQIEVEINLQRGDTEEELERNYQIKLKHQEEVREREQELQMMEKRKRAMMMMEEQPTFAQLYLNVEHVAKGGITIDRDGNDIVVPETVDGATEPLPDLSRSNRNLYVAYKAFPSLEKL